MLDGRVICLYRCSAGPAQALGCDTYNVKSSNIALNAGYYKGDFNKIEEGPFEDKKSFQKSLAAPKEIERTPSLVWFCMLCLKSKN